MFMLLYLTVAPDGLTDMVGFMTRDTGLVLQMPFCCDRKGFAGIYEKVSISIWALFFIMWSCLTNSYHVYIPVNMG